MVVTPSEIWSSARGKRPVTMDKSTGPRMAVPATVSTVLPFTEISWLVPRVIRVTAGSCSSFVNNVVTVCWSPGGMPDTANW